MNNKEYVEPMSYEEAIERKKEILKVLNKYNEDILLNNPTELTEEQVEQLKEEYEILDENVINEEEKEQIDAVHANPKKVLAYVGIFLYFIFEGFILFYWTLLLELGFLVQKTNLEAEMWVLYLIAGGFGLLNLLFSFFLFTRTKNSYDRKLMLVLFFAHTLYFIANFLYMIYILSKYA
jgi:hypothetical protein